jgi:hypothetical protein
MQDTETFAWYGYSLDTGAQLWGPVVGTTRAFSYYGSGLGGGQMGFAAYGKLYTQGYGGEICCFDGKTGNLVWKFNQTSSGIESVWGNYPTFIAAIADGKVYAFTNEHSPNYPLYKGEQIYCIDAYDGHEVYSMLSWAGQTGGNGASTSVLADGVLCYYNYYDNQIYAIGKGTSATTVTATPGVGNVVTIQGTVTDQSAGAKAKVASGEFSVVPAISDADQAAWMETLYMQQPCPTDTTGVAVHLTAIDPNGNYQDIGTVTSGVDGSYAISWVPPVPGLYKITASFEGSESYYSSTVTTHFLVDAAPSPAVAPTSDTPTTTYIAIAIAAAVVIIAAALMLRRHK